ncbi:hypothetical protein K1719_016097 [Acacia pycnantha]|nr:hypothetical protein K1719_016097 [Acacia pycnantha]
MTTSFSYLFKTIIVGDTTVGKSCLLYQYNDNRFQQTHDVTVGGVFGAKTIPIDNKLIKLCIWDTAGEEKFRSITRSFYREAVAALLVYDVTRKETFNHLDSWLKDIREHADTNLTVVLVGNKCDLYLERQVSTEEGEEFAKENGLIFLEASVKMFQNVNEAFEEAAKSVCKKVEDGVFDLSNERCGIRKGKVGNINLRFGGGTGGGYWNGCCRT